MKMRKLLIFMLLASAAPALSAQAQPMARIAAAVEASQTNVTPVTAEDQATTPKERADLVAKFTGVAAATTDAGQATLSVAADRERRATISSERYTEVAGHINTTARSPRGGVKSSALPSSYNAVEYDNSYVYGDNSISGLADIVIVDDSNAVIYGLWGYTDTIPLTYDLEAGTVQITPSRIYTSSTYGEVWMCQIDIDSMTYSTSKAISGAITADGKITTGAWGAFVVSGTYKGGYFDIYTHSVLQPTNATMTDVIYDGSDVTNTDSVVSYPVYIEQTYDNQIVIANFGNLGAEVKARLSGDSTVTIVSQYMFTSYYYGDFYTYAADYSSSTNKGTGTIVGTGHSAQIELGNWGVFALLYSTYYNRKVLSTVISFEEGSVSYPAARTLDWSGDGTESSPYVLKTMEQVFALSEKVSQGESFEGKYISLGNDIDMTNATSVYSPIGTSSAPFAATLDGCGYSIKNLLISTGNEEYQGFIGYADTMSVIKNITIVSPVIETAGRYAGALAGASAGTISNVAVTGADLTFKHYAAGGVVGYFNGIELTGATFQGAIDCAGDCGGIAGQILGYAVASDLVAHGTITMTDVVSTTYASLGGIVGTVLPQSKLAPVISGCYTDAIITDESGYGDVGGIVGELSSGTLLTSFNAGPVTGSAFMTVSSLEGTEYNGCLGGIVGMCFGGTVSDCYNANTIINTSYTYVIGGTVAYVLSPLTSSSGSSYTSQFNRCLNVGQVYQSTVVETMGAYGGVYYSDSIFHDMYFDQQVVGTTMPESTSWMALTTAQLTSGTALDNYDTTVWDFTAGLYPRLKALKDNDAAYLGAAPLTFSTGENVNKVKTTFSISTDNSVYWKLYSSGAYVDQSTGLTISGDSVSLSNCYSNETLVALSSNNSSILKPYYLSTVNPSAFTGSGTESDPYLISSKADYITLDEAISTYGQYFKGDYFKQTCDIDFQNSTDFQGVGRGGTTTLVFNGTLDGGGHEIQNLTIDEIVLDSDGAPSSSSSDISIALFGFIGEYGTVKNLTIASSCTFKAYSYAGSIAVGNYGTITGCKNYAPVTVASSYAGGIVALNYADATVEQCYNAGAVTTSYRYAGGIASYNAGTIVGNQNNGDVTGDSIYSSWSDGVQLYIAGIAGYNIGGSQMIGNINAGNVFGAYYVGGIMAYMATIEVTGNINYGAVEFDSETSAYRGAILGSAAGTASTVADNYYDAQIGYYGASASKASTGMNGTTTSALTSGTALDGLDADAIDFTAGLYPVIAAYKDEAAVAAHRKMVVNFADADAANDIVADAPLYKADDLSWELTSGEYFEISGDTLRVKEISGTSSLRDTLVATVDIYKKVIPLLAMPPVFDGSGTLADPFQIKTPQDMLLLADITNNEGFPYSGRYFKVMNDIDFDTLTYVPVGYGSGSFNGNFNGNGMKFKNVNNTYESTSDTYIGLFGTFDTDAELYDLTLESGTVTGYRYIGGFAGNVYGLIHDCSNYATVTTGKSNGCGGIAAVVKSGGIVRNCTNYGNICATTGQNGGIAYKVESGGTIDSCVNAADLTATTTIQAGISAYSAGTISNCVNRGAITGAGTVGGIVASSQAGDSILYCHNEGAVTGTGNYTGGILGYLPTSQYGLYIEGCWNEGAISGTSYTGGVGGRFYGGSVMVSCYNTGTVSGTSSYAGGVIGNHYYNSGYDSKAYGCYNTGTVTSTGNYAGGVAGYVASGDEYYNCYNLATVTTTGSYSGGFAGSCAGTAHNCYNAGNVTASGSGIGGFAGLGAGTVYGCFNLGDVTSTSGSNSNGVAGGLWGYGRPNVYYSYNMGTVTGPTRTAGLTGGTFSNIVLQGCYNAGAVACSNSTYAGNISPTSSYTSTATLTGTCYDTDVNSGLTVSNVDELADGLTTRALTLTAINDSAFQTLPGMYPTLIAQADNQLANYFAAVPVVAEGDTYTNVTSAITIGTPEGTTWTGSSNLYISDGAAYSTETGDAWLTKTYGDYSKTYTFYVTAATGIGEVLADNQVAKREYYTVGGMLTGDETPDASGIYIERVTYVDGRTACRKVAVTKR